MAHQRYQAAIEAYKKAPTNEPAVWNKLGIAYQLMFDLDRCEAELRESPTSSIQKTQTSLTISAPYLTQ